MAYLEQLIKKKKKKKNWEEIKGQSKMNQCYIIGTKRNKY